MVKLGRRPVTISVPASIANLGPGLDTLGLAVSLYLRAKVRRIEGVNQLRFHFVNLELQGDNLIERGFRRLSGGREFPSLEIEVETDIPLRSGLGSSAAAMAAGFRIFEAVFGPQPEQVLLDAGCELEGHPENVAAALLGGLVACCQGSDGSVIALRASWPRALRIVVTTPEVQLETRRSRAVLPPSVALRCAVSNLQRVAVAPGSVACAKLRRPVGGVPRLPASAQPLRHCAVPRSVAGPASPRCAGRLPERVRSLGSRRGDPESQGCGRDHERHLPRRWSELRDQDRWRPHRPKGVRRRPCG